MTIYSGGYNSLTGQVGLVCYLKGTKILTDHGPVAVEDLREGDSVVCRFGGLRPIRWIGRQQFAGPRAAGREAIRFAPGSIGNGMPQEDLFVSPGHSMLVGETLVLASTLVNGLSITRETPRDEWSYFQLDLGDHGLVLANGTWSESFADCGDFRSMFDNVAEFRERFPDHCAPDTPALCAERPAGGVKLHAALDVTARRALALQQPVAPGRLEGRIEAVAAACHVTGWAMDADHPGRPVLLEVVLDDEVIGETCACGPRPGARDQGRMGFVFDGRRRLSADELLRLVVRRKQDGQVLAPVTSTPAGPLHGHLDLITDTGRLSGWARDKADPQRPVMLEVVLGDEVLGAVLACRPRTDLEKAGLGDVAFVFDANRTLASEEIGALYLRRAGDGARLKQSEGTKFAPSKVA
ncbi:Hint domain-containing protein [Paracoccus endophyticus]|uniref:Hint domain-containing protein n=1 Tax=Paracoccus endophyticus TaxID=2233774 RepID=UPI000DD50C36|nr:Hint domain-containing protein [Paracoccus endophyticus]